MNAVYDMFEKAKGQMTDDRSVIDKQYKMLEIYLSENPDRYAILGDTLAKYSELLIKQKAQMVDLIKVSEKFYDKDAEEEELSEEDLEQITGEIKKGA